MSPSIDLRADVPVSATTTATHTLTTSNAGGSQPHNNMQPYLAVNFIIALEGIYPSRS